MGRVEVDDRPGAGLEVGRVFGGAEILGGVVRRVEPEQGRVRRVVWSGLRPRGRE